MHLKDIVVKNSAIFFIILSFLYGNFSFAKNNANSSDPYPPRIPKVWHVVWVSSTSAPLTALWTKESESSPMHDNDYYGVWNNELRAHVTINYGLFEFDGYARMNNGDYCEIRGTIYDSSPREKIFDGSYACSKGDKGTITGSAEIYH